MNKYLKWLIAVIVTASLAYGGTYIFVKLKNSSEQSAKTPEIIPIDDGLVETDSITENRTHRLGFPSFIPSIRTYGGGGYDQEQIRTLKEAGFEYVQSLVDFNWINIQRGPDLWKWGATDQQMSALDASGLKTIPFLMWPKSASAPYDETIIRNSPEGIRAFGEYAYQVVNRYKNRSSWSGLVAVWGGSADVWDHEQPLTDPEVIVPLLNAAYDGIKRADPSTTVIGFNFATTTGATDSDWEEYHTRAFAQNPKFDWYGVQSHAVAPTITRSNNKYGGLQGLLNVRKFLDDHGYANKPLWLNEGGYYYNNERDSQIQAEFVVESFIMGATIPVDLKGWVYFAYFGKTSDSDEGVMGIMTSLDEDSPPQPRLAWNAVKTLLKTIRFEDYSFDRKISGEPDGSSPFVYKFRKEQNAELWTVFLPRLQPADKNEQLRDSSPQNVVINIGTNTTATVTEMYGDKRTMTADSSGNITVRATNKPMYIEVGNQ